MPELTNKLVIKLFEVLKEKDISVPKLSTALDIPSDRIYKWKQQGTNPKAEDEVKIKDWLKESGLDIYPRVGKYMSVTLENEMLTMKQKIIRNEATIAVLRVTVEEFISSSKKKSIAIISAELQKAIASIEEGLYDQWGKKQ